MQNKSLGRRLTVKKGLIQVVQTSDYIEGPWELISKLPPEARVGDVRFVSRFKMSVFLTQWCGFPGICTLRSSPEHPDCDVPVRLRFMRLRVVSIPPASLLLFYLQTRSNETFNELTMRNVILIGHSTILRRLVK